MKAIEDYRWCWAHMKKKPCPTCKRNYAELQEALRRCEDQYAKDDDD